MIIIHRRNDHADLYDRPFYGRQQQQRHQHCEGPSLWHRHFPLRHQLHHDDYYMRHPMMYSGRCHPSHQAFYYASPPMDQPETVAATAVMAPYAVPPFSRYQSQPRHYKPESVMPVVLLFSQKRDGKQANDVPSDNEKASANAAGRKAAPLMAKQESREQGREMSDKEGLPDVAKSALEEQTTEEKKGEQNGPSPEVSDSKPAAKEQQGTSSVKVTAQIEGNDKSKGNSKTNQGGVDPFELLLRLFHEPDICRAISKQPQVDLQQQQQHQQQHQQKPASTTTPSEQDKRSDGDANVNANANANANAGTHVYKADDDDEAVTINVNVTGYGASDLFIKYDSSSGSLTVSGERSNKLGYRTSFVRRVPLDERRYDVDGVSARLADDVLSVRVPRRRRPLPASRSIDIVSEDGKSSNAQGIEPSEVLACASASQPNEDVAVGVVMPGQSDDDAVTTESGCNDRGTEELAKAAAPAAQNAEAADWDKKEVENGCDDAFAKPVHADHEDAGSVASSVSNASFSHKSSVSVRTVSSDDEDDDGEESFEAV